MERYRDVLAIVHSNTPWIESPSEREHTFSPYYGLIAGLIRQEQERGAIDLSINPDVTAILIVGTIYYAAEECYVYGSPIPSGVFIAESARFIQRALGIT